MCNLLLFMALFCGTTAAPSYELKEYGKYDVRSAFSAVTAADGSQRYRIDAELIDHVVDDLASHAADYPPKFRTKEEQTRATRDATVLVELFEILAGDGDAGTKLLLKAAFADHIAFNLDIKGAAEKAARNYERALKREPDHPQANLSYGIFLAGAGALQKKSLPYLEKALRLGREEARYTLGLVHLTLGDKEKAIEYLEAFQKTRPDDERPVQIIAAIKSGRFVLATVRRSGATEVHSQLGLGFRSRRACEMQNSQYGLPPISMKDGCQNRSNRRKGLGPLVHETSAAFAALRAFAGNVSTVVQSRRTAWQARPQQPRSCAGVSTPGI